LGKAVQRATAGQQEESHRIKEKGQNRLTITVEPHSRYSLHRQGPIPMTNVGEAGIDEHTMTGLVIDWMH
jgi:hypothetical protein